MKCPFCSHLDTQVVETRPSEEGDSVRRRRQCGACERRFTTYERPDVSFPNIVKKDGRRIDYQREKLLGSMRLALRKRPVSTEQIDSAIERIEEKLLALSAREVPSTRIGELVMRELRKLDKVAYVRFASVYREFRDVDEFVAELQEPQTAAREDGTPYFAFAKEEDKSTEQAASEQPGLFTPKNSSPTESKSS
jgi:transcriptional repressor NrdR